MKKSVSVTYCDTQASTLTNGQIDSARQEVVLVLLLLLLNVRESGPRAGY